MFLLLPLSIIKLQSSPPEVQLVLDIFGKLIILFLNRWSKPGPSNNQHITTMSPSILPSLSPTASLFPGCFYSSSITKFSFFLSIFCKINLNIKFSLWIFIRSMSKLCTFVALHQIFSLSIVVCLKGFSTCFLGGCSLSSLVNIICFASCCTTTFKSKFLGRTSIKWASTLKVS